MSLIKRLVDKIKLFTADTNQARKINALLVLVILLMLPLILVVSKQRQNTAQFAANEIPTQTLAPVHVAFTPSGMRDVPDPLYGVTVDNVANISGIVESLSHFTHKPTTRIVFDGGTQPSDYQQAITQIQPVSYILGMLADSTAIKSYSAAAYAQRARDFLAAFGNQVDIWEVGNEINGEWLGTDVPNKMINAYNVIKQAGKRTELTLYYNGLDDNNNCYSNKNNLMFRWAQANIPDSMKQGLDYVLISFYEQDCPGVSKDWTTVFTQLHQMFPNSRIGFGENGTTKFSDNASLKIQYMNEYYPVWVNVPCYVAGHFWWYFYQDGIPYSNNTLWTTLNNDMNAMVMPASTGCGEAPTGVISGGPTNTSAPTSVVTATITLSPTSYIVTPTLYCLGSCPTIPVSQEPINQVSTQPTQQIQQTVTPEIIISQVPSVIPSSNGPVPSVPANPKQIQPTLLQILLQFIMLLLNLFRNLFR